MAGPRARSHLNGPGGPGCHGVQQAAASEAGGYGASEGKRWKPPPCDWAWNPRRGCNRLVCRAINAQSVRGGRVGLKRTRAEVPEGRGETLRLTPVCPDSWLVPFRSPSSPLRLWWLGEGKISKLRESPKALPPTPRAERANGHSG